MMRSICNHTNLSSRLLTNITDILNNTNDQRKDVKVCAKSGFQKNNATGTKPRVSSQRQAQNIINLAPIFSVS